MISNLAFFVKEKQGLSQQSESGGAKPQIVLKVGGKYGKLMASISDFGKKLAKVGGSCPLCPPGEKCSKVSFMTLSIAQRDLP